VSGDIAWRQQGAKFRKGLPKQGRRNGWGLVSKEGFSGLPLLTSRSWFDLQTRFYLVCQGSLEVQYVLQEAERIAVLRHSLSVTLDVGVHLTHRRMDDFGLGQLGPSFDTPTQKPKGLNLRRLPARDERWAGNDWP